MAIGAGTLFVASAIHSGVGSFDPFPGAAIPEALIGGVLAVATIASLVWPSASAVAIVAIAFAIVGTLFGLGFTVPRGQVGDIAYHVALLTTLLIAGALLVRARLTRA